MQQSLWHIPRPCIVRVAEHDAEPAGEVTLKVYSPSSDLTIAAIASLCLVPSDVILTVSLGGTGLLFLYLAHKQVEYIKVL